MNELVSVKMLNVYDLYNGDIDRLCRNNISTEKAIFGNDLDKIWIFIASMYQNVELISKRLTSDEYTKNTLMKLKEKLDADAFMVITNKISFYLDFQKIKEILEIIKSWTTNETDTVWAGYDNGKEFLIDLNMDIEKISFCSFETLERLNMEFLPTSTYQEISLSNGWGNDFLKIARQFDVLYERIKKQSKNDNKKSWWKFW